MPSISDRMRRLAIRPSRYKRRKKQQRKRYKKYNKKDSKIATKAYVKRAISSINERRFIKVANNCLFVNETIMGYPSNTTKWGTVGIHLYSSPLAASYYAPGLNDQAGTRFLRNATLFGRFREGAKITLTSLRTELTILSPRTFVQQEEICSTAGILFRYWIIRDVNDTVLSTQEYEARLNPPYAFITRSEFKDESETISRKARDVSVLKTGTFKMDINNLEIGGVHPRVCIKKTIVYSFGRNGKECTFSQSEVDQNDTNPSATMGGLGRYSFIIHAINSTGQPITQAIPVQNLCTCKISNTTYFRDIE